MPDLHQFFQFSNLWLALPSPPPGFPNFIIVLAMLVCLAGSLKNSVRALFHFRTLIIFFESYFLIPKINKIGAISIPDAKENQWRQISNIFPAIFPSLLGAIFSSFLISMITFVCFLMVFCNVTRVTHIVAPTELSIERPELLFLFVVTTEFFIELPEPHFSSSLLPHGASLPHGAGLPQVRARALVLLAPTHRGVGCHQGGWVLFLRSFFGIFDCWPRKIDSLVIWREGRS